MAQNFLSCDRDQRLLLPPDLREWLPDGHLAWFVIEAVSELDLAEFCAGYRADGWGRAAHDPGMMVALMLYSYAVGVRSSRGIERRCREDVAFRVICAGAQPDHTTIARFRARHERALANLFAQVLALCAHSGLGSVGTVALDSTRIAADASRFQTRTYERVARELLEEAKRIDAAEDELYGEARGDELPPELRTREGRRRKLREAKARLDEEKARREAEEEAELRERAERHARRRAEGKKPIGRPPKPASERRTKPKALRANLTDPDSRLVKTPTGFVQGYCAQAVVCDDHLIVAAEIAAEGVDGGQLEPMVAAAGGSSRPPGSTPGLRRCSPTPATSTPTRSRRSRPGRRRCWSRPAPGRRASAPSSIAAQNRRRRGRVRARCASAWPKRSPATRPSADTNDERLWSSPSSARSSQTEGATGLPPRHRRGRSEWRLFASTHNLLRLWRATAAAEATKMATATA